MDTSSGFYFARFGFININVCFAYLPGEAINDVQVTLKKTWLLLRANRWPFIWLIVSLSMLCGVVILGSELKESLVLSPVWALAGAENPNFSVINIEILKLCFGFFIAKPTPLTWVLVFLVYFQILSITYAGLAKIG